MNRCQSTANRLSLKRMSGFIWTGIFLAGALQAQEAEPPLLEKTRQWFKPLPGSMATPEFPARSAQITLGRQLFFDPRISLDGTVSCATCHRPALYGTDALPKSIGVEHRLSTRNAPTVLNAALQFKIHWTGDRANVEEQATKSLTGTPASAIPNQRQ